LARILLGVSGGIAAYKGVELVRLATGAGHSVRVIQTPASLNFVGRATFEGVTGAPVLVDEFEADPARGAFPGEPAPDHDPISHLELVARADVFVVAPASANTIAKLAAGLADNLLTSAALANTAPLVVAPAMNSRMYEHPATQGNLELLRSRGARVVDPGTGRLASKGEWGVGRLAEPAEILAAIEEVLGATGSATASDRGYAPRSLDGLRVLVTAGGTREPIDSVRFIGNRSSGRMGVALAEEAARRGADVTLVAANLAIPLPAGVATVTVETTAELDAAVRERFEGADVLIMAAAPADFRPREPGEGKLTRESGGLTLELESTEDIVA
jgi:phosphopantothenoylcysteine decarboxylase / phosphopantothenate---cysteine ligase